MRQGNSYMGVAFFICLAIFLLYFSIAPAAHRGVGGFIAEWGAYTQAVCHRPSGESLCPK